jgi:multidrug resistance efflux pump
MTDTVNGDLDMRVRLAELDRIYAHTHQLVADLPRIEAQTRQAYADAERARADIDRAAAQTRQANADIDRAAAQTRQAYADAERKRQEMTYQPIIALISGMTAGAALLAAGFALAKLLGM